MDIPKDRKKIPADAITFVRTPRPLMYEHDFQPYITKEEIFGYIDVSKGESDITSTISASGASLIFEKSGTKSTFFVNAIPNKDNSERKIMVISNKKPLEPSKWSLKKEITSKDAIKSLKEWGGEPKELGILSDFLQGKLRTVNVDEEKKIRGSVDSTGPKLSGEFRKKKATIDSV